MCDEKKKPRSSLSSKVRPLYPNLDNKYLSSRVYRGRGLAQLIHPSNDAGIIAKGRAIGIQTISGSFLRVLYPTFGSPLTITQPPWACNLMPYQGLRWARCSYYTLVPIVDDTCKRRPIRRRVCGTSWRKTPMSIRSVGH